MKIYFKDLTVKRSFKFGGVKWVKTSTRTAALLENKKWFYFSKNDACDI